MLELQEEHGRWTNQWTWILVDAEHAVRHGPIGQRDKHPCAFELPRSSLFTSYEVCETAMRQVTTVLAQRSTASLPKRRKRWQG